MSARPSDYERRALAEIREWKKPERGWLGQKIQAVRWPLDRLGTRIKNFAEQRELYKVISEALVGTVGVLGDAVAWTVRPAAVYQQFREAGHHVEQRTDIFTLDLEQVDGVVGWLDTKYKGLAFTEGAATGAAGVLGLIVDIPSLITLNIRAIGEYATYYGFNIKSPQERLFAMQVLVLASSPTDAAKVRAMGEVARIGAAAAKKTAWKDLEKASMVRVIQKVSKALGVRLTKAKLAQAVPIVGGVVGGGFNAYYTARVCDAAYQLYRERFLAEKYGP